MPLVTAADVRLVPGLTSSVTIPDDWLDQLCLAADYAVKKYVKRDIELRSYTEFYSGNLQPDTILRQYPVYSGLTTVTAASDGVTLPVATLHVSSTSNFPPVASGYAHSLTVQVTPSTYTTLTYTGKTATTFTGCSGGTGTLYTGGNVYHPTVWQNPIGYYGQSPSGFDDGNIVVNGSQFVVVLDSGGIKSHRGLLRCIAGTGTAGPGFFWQLPGNTYMGKLAAYSLPRWPIGSGNIKVAYSAGYASTEIPEDIKMATVMLVAQMIRNQPSGSMLSTESLGGYSYSVLSGRVDIPDIGNIQKTLSSYRESSWGIP